MRASAVSKVKSSGYELVRKQPHKGKLATERDYAKMDWKPWKRTPDMKEGALLPNDGAFESCYVPCRLAYATLLMTRDDMIAMHGKADHGDIDKLMGQLRETEEWLKGVAAMLQNASLRIIASAAAFHQRGGKFPGVHDMRRKDRKRRRA